MVTREQQNKLNILRLLIHKGRTVYGILWPPKSMELKVHTSALINFSFEMSF